MRLLDGIVSVRTARKAREQAALSEIAVRLSTLSAAIHDTLLPAAKGEREDLADLRSFLADRVEALRGEVGKLGREQFRVSTLLEGQEAALEELSGAMHEQLRRREHEAGDARRALAELAGEIRLGFARDLLPLADALSESVRTAAALAPAAPAAQPPQRSWLSRLRGAPPPQQIAGVDLTAFEAWLNGLRLVERRLLTLLEREEIRPIPSVGQPFDPNRHLAVGIDRRVDGRVPDGTVVEEHIRGYTAGERVLRHAEVVVARVAPARDDERSELQ